MKRFFLIIFLIIFLFSCKSISNVAMKPTKNKEVGSLAGKIQFTTNLTYWGMKANTYKNKILVIIQNKKNKRKYTTYSQNGYYYFYNLPVGDYTFNGWKYKIEVTVKSSENDSGVTQILRNDIKDFDFTIEDKVFKTVKNILVEINIPKNLMDKNNYYTRFEDEDLTELKERFVKKDVQGLWNEFVWKEQSITFKEEQATLTTDSLVDRYFSESDSDFYTMEQLYKKNEYYLSFVLFHRIILNMLKGVYVKRIDKDVPETEDLLELAKKVNLDINVDQSILLNDLNTLNDRIIRGDADANFKSLFVKDYFDKYLKKVIEFRKFIKDAK